VAAPVILTLNFVVGSLRASFGLAERLFEGSPTLIVHDGQLVLDHLRKEHLSEADILQAMREHGIDDLGQVKLAVLEADGSISIIQSEQAAAITRTRRRVRRQPHP
jgi:uncharacterized membrane protein YcaP (DUF421 family)